VKADDGVTEIYSWAYLENLLGVEQGSLPVGEIPIEILRFENLTNLHLLNVGLTSVSAELRNLRRLTSLRLEMDNIHHLPEELFAEGWPSLVDLSFANNKLESLPKSMKELSSLTFLDLANNRLGNEVLEIDFRNLTQLQLFRIEKNRLKSLPETLMNPASPLNFLDCSENMIESIPDSIGNLRMLKSFYAHNNYLRTLPPGFGSLQSLTGLFVQHNVIETLPAEIGDLSNLRQIYIGNNKLKQFPDTVVKLKKLSELAAGSNRLESLPFGMGSMRISLLNLEYNKLKSIPDDLGNITTFTGLWLNGNNLQYIPESFRNLKGIRALYLHENNLTSVVVGSAWEITLDHNNLEDLNGLAEGSFPSLFRLTASHNKIRILERQVLKNLPKVAELDLSYNELTYVANAISELEFLSDVNFAHNQLKTLPKGLDEINTIRSLNLGGNPFVCDKASLSWLTPNVLNLVKDPDFTTCGDANEYAGFPVHRLGFREEEPGQSAEILGFEQHSHHLNLFWRYVPASEEEIGDYPDGNPDGRILFGTSIGIPQDPDETRNRSYPLPIPGNVFNCDVESIGQIPGQDIFHMIPSLAFQLDWRRVDEGSLAWESLCFKSITGGEIYNLQPFTEYDVRLRPVFLRWDVPIGAKYGPRSSAGPRTLPIRLRTLPAAPGDAPRNVLVESTQRKESSLLLEWDPPSEPNSGVLTYLVEARHESELIFRMNTTRTTITVGSLSSNSKYEFRVRALSSNDIPGPWSLSVVERTAAACPAGSQRMDAEVYQCLPCELNFYRGSDQAACVECPSDFPMTLEPGATSLDDCVTDAGFFELEMPEGERVSLSCRDVDLHDRLDCRSNLVGLTVETVPIVPGFWRISNHTLDIRKCPEERFCRSSAEARAGFGDRLCSAHHRGIYCVECEEGFGMHSGSCRECNEGTLRRERFVLSLWSILFMALAVLPSIWLLIKSFSKGKLAKAGIDSRVFIRAGLLEEIGVNIRIALGFFQVYFLFAGTVGLFDSDAFFAFKSIFDLDFGSFLRSLPVACVVDLDFYGVLLLYTVYPITVCGLMCAVALCVTRPCLSDRFPIVAGKALWISEQIGFFIYPGVSSTIFSTFLYEGFEGYFALRADYSIDYESNSSQFWRKYAALMIAVYPIGVIVAFAILIHKFQVWSRIDAKDRSNLQVQLRGAVAFLSRPYRFSYFECLEFFRKLLLTSVFLLVRQSSTRVANAFFLLIAQVALVWIAVFRPYRAQANFFLAFMSDSLLCALGFVSIFLDLEPGSTSKAAYASTIVIGVIEGIALLIAMIWPISVAKFEESLKKQAVARRSSSVASKTGNVSAKDNSDGDDAVDADSDDDYLDTDVDQDIDTGSDASVEKNRNTTEIIIA